MAKVTEDRPISFILRAGNKQCADCKDCDCEKCGFPDPVWVSAEFGVIVCDECKSLHESITRTEFKSILNTQEWTESDWLALEDTSNSKVNAIYEARMPLGYQKPTRCFNRTFREHFLSSKYVKRHFMASGDQLEGGVPSYLKIGEKTGYLWKRGRDDMVFARRWFVFACERGSLVYYTDSNKQNQRGEILLRNVHVCQASEEKIHHPNGLQLIIIEDGDVRMIYLYADHEKDMVEWYHAICIVKFYVAKHAAIAAKKTLTNEEILRDLNEEVVKEGYMMKTDSSATKPFRRRWFVLHGRTLMYFKNDLAANPMKRPVVLGTHAQGFSLILSGEYHPNRPQGGKLFLLKTPDRTFTFIAHNEHERTAWYKALIRACGARKCSSGEVNRPTPPPRPSTTTELPPPPPVNERPLPNPPPGRPVPQPRISSLGNPVIFPPPPPIPEKSTNSYLAPLPRPRSRGSESPVPPVSPSSSPPGSPRGTRAGPPPVAPRPIDMSKHGGNASSGMDSSDDDSSDGEYVTLETVPVICTKVNSYTCVQLAQGYCLRIPHGALDIDAGKQRKCFVSVTPQQFIVCPEIANAQTQPGINAHGAQIVDCTSFNYKKPLRKPLQLEVPHCAIIGDLAECTIKFWHNNSTSDDNTKWRLVLQDNAALSCQVKQRCVQITTLHMGSYAFLLDGPGVLGKAMQMAVFSKTIINTDIVMAHIYLFNHIGSDSVWLDVEEKEYNNGSILSDVSPSFSVYRGHDELSLTIQNLEGLTFASGQSNSITIPTTEMWQSPFVQMKAKFGVTATTGNAKITLHQSNPTGGISLEEQVLFHYTPDEHAALYMTVEDIQDATREMHSRAPGSRASVVTGADLYMDVRYYPPPTRWASARHEAQRRQTIRHGHALSRRAPFSRTTPVRKVKMASKTGKCSGSSSTTTSETSSDASGGLSAAGDGGAVIPEGLKEVLSDLLDVTASHGNDWSMLVKYIGLDHLMHRFIAEPHPTIAVLDCCEQMDIGLVYLENAMRDIDRNDAASSIRPYITQTGGEQM